MAHRASGSIYYMFLFLFFLMPLRTYWPILLPVFRYVGRAPGQ